MRTVRWLAFGLALIALLPSASAAQQGRLFRDSWFWGASAGAMSFSTATVSNQQAPVVNLEWFITRTRGGLYLSAGRSFFTANAGVKDNLGTLYNVQIQDMTQFQADLIALPVAWGPVHLYAGGGFQMNIAHSAVVTDSILNPNTKTQVEQTLKDQQDAIRFNLLLGVHAQLKRIAIFGNAEWLPAMGNFVLGQKATWMLEGGIRLNFGPSDESQQ
jgi:hypothetical protein